MLKVKTIAKETNNYFNFAENILLLSEIMDLLNAPENEDADILLKWLRSLSL